MPAVAPRRLRTRLMLLYAGPFVISGALLLALQTAQTAQTVPADTGGGRPPPVEPHAEVMQRVLAGAAIGIVTMAVLSVVLGWFVAGRFLRPLRTITSTAQEISATSLHRRLPLGRRDDEFADLGRTLNALFARLEAAFESQRRFVANASHELRTPLTAERTLLQVALADPDADTRSLRAACHEVLALGEEQRRLIDALLTLAVGERGIDRTEPLDLAEVAGEVLTARRDEATRRRVTVEPALGPAPTHGDPPLVESLLANLIDNGLRHNGDGGRVTVTTGVDTGRARLVVENTGPVVPPAELDRLFQPFQQLGADRVHRRGGHGLGLAIVRAVADAHGATLVAHARPGGGLRVEVTFS